MKLNGEMCNFTTVKNSNELELDCSQEFYSLIDSFVHIGSAAHPIKSKVMRPENLDKLLVKLAQINL